MIILAHNQTECSLDVCFFPGCCPRRERGMKIGYSDRQIRFLGRWAKTRKKGKVRYVILRGVLLGIALFMIWLSFGFRDFQYYKSEAVFFIRCAMWKVWSFILGFNFAWLIWRKREEKYEYLSE